MDYVEYINKLINVFKEGLPGFESQIKAAPRLRENHKDLDAIRNAKRSAVLLLLYPQNGSIYIPFIKRISDGSMHSGQIAFPGGKYEKDDKDLMFTAKREAEEEVGINKNDVEVLKELTPLYIPVSNYLVQPIVGKVNYSPNFVANSKEVDKIFEINIKELYNSYIIDKEFSIRDNKITAPFFILNKLEIWGATAMILSEFIDILKKVDYN